MTEKELQKRQIDGFELVEHKANEAAKSLKKKEELLLKVLNLALEALSRRVLLFAALAGTMFLFFLAMGDPRIIRTVTAVTCACTVLLPILYKDFKDGK